MKFWYSQRYRKFCYKRDIGEFHWANWASRRKIGMEISTECGPILNWCYIE